MTTPNLSKIKEDFDKVIQYSQQIPNPKTDRLFDIWWECKKDFIDLFGGECIYEFPYKISFDLSAKEKHDRVIRFAGQVASQWGYTNLADFIEKQEDGFFQNLTVEDYIAWDGKVIHKGSKLVKSFKHFIKDNDRSLFDIQNEASKIIQEDKIEGTLCLSVHPLDFLSLSENTYNWRSCHSLDGEYRAGNLSYMMDKHTIICYLKGADNVNLQAFHPEVKWNSKKWRVLLYISEDWNMIFAGRQYPFESKTGMDIVLREALRDVGITKKDSSANAFRQFCWTDWNNTLISKCELSNGVKIDFDSPYVPVGEHLIELDKLFAEGIGAKNYNDVLHSSCYKPIYTFKYMTYPWETKPGGIPMTAKGKTTFNIGGFTYCLWCGEEECLTGAETMMCEKCELEHGTTENDLFTTCDNCGRRIYTDDSYSVGDDNVCQHCFDKYTRHCDCCEEVVYDDQICYHEGTQQYVCKYCYEELNEMNEKEYSIYG